MLDIPCKFLLEQLFGNERGKRSLRVKYFSWNPGWNLPREKRFLFVVTPFTTGAVWELNRDWIRKGKKDPVAVTHLEKKNLLVFETSCLSSFTHKKYNRSAVAWWRRQNWQINTWFQHLTKTTEKYTLRCLIGAWKFYLKAIKTANSVKLILF